MKSASGPLMGRLAAFKRRITPGPASNKSTRPPTTTAVAGPDAAGSGYGVPVPSRITLVVVAFKSDLDKVAVSGGSRVGGTSNPRTIDKRIASAVCISPLTPSQLLERTMNALDETTRSACEASCRRYRTARGSERVRSPHVSKGDTRGTYRRQVKRVAANFFVTSA